ncbi:MAG: hypothetical protein ACXVDS_02450 [Actinomycetota bacterium]
MFAVALTLIVYMRYRPTRSPRRSVDEFKNALRALSSDEPNQRS